PTPAENDSWLIVDKGSGLGDEIVRRMQHLGRRAVLAVDDDETRQLLREPFGGIVYLCGAGEEADAPGAAERSSVEVLDMAQALMGAGVAPRLWLVTQGSQPVTSGDLVRLAPSVIWGLGRTLQLESPALQCACVDLPSMPVSADVNALLSEL